MNMEPNEVPESSLDAKAGVPVAAAKTRPLYWSVRRELWENRSIYIGPLAAASVYLLGYFISLVWVPFSMSAMLPPDSTPPLIRLAMPYAHAGMLIALAGFFVGIFYSLDALHAERRDRSILFWKSLPVSDLTTVLSKAIIPLAVLPALVLVLTVAVQFIMRLMSALSPSVSGRLAVTHLPLFEMQVVWLYTVAVLALWHAPIYCWFLLVSGWAKRATFLWAVFPPAALAILEKIAFNSSYLAELLHNRIGGFGPLAFDFLDKNGVPIDPHFIPLAQLAPGRFLSSPGLWLGLLFAALCLAGAIRLRRYQGPI